MRRSFLLPLLALPIACSSAGPLAPAPGDDASPGARSSSPDAGPRAPDGSGGRPDGGGGERDASPAKEASLPTEAGPDAPAETGDGGACSVVLPGDCLGPVAAYSVNAKVVSAYPATAPLFRVYRVPDGATSDVLQAGQGSYANGAGTPDVTQVASWIAAGGGASGSAVVLKVYDQSGNENDAVQANPGAAPALVIDTLGPTQSMLSLSFSSSTASARAAYAGDTTDGSGLVIGSLTGSDPTTLTFAPSPPQSADNRPTGAPFPELVAPEYWILPGFAVEDKDLPDGGSLVVTASATGLVLSGAPTGSGSYSKSITVSPPNVWLDLPSSVTVAMNDQTVLVAARSGTDGVLDYVTLGQDGEAAAGAGSYAALSSQKNNSVEILANDATLASNGSVTTKLATALFSNDIDVYGVSRSGGTVDYDLGELGSGSVTDDYASTVTLRGGSLGFTQQLKGAPGSFEGFGFLVFGTALSAPARTAALAALRTALAIPTPAITQVVYTGASTVIGHGIAGTEAPAKRLGEDLVQAGHPVRTFTVGELSEDLLTDLASGGTAATIYKQGKGTSILVIHATAADSFNAFQSGSWPSVCGAAGSIPYEECLWTVVRDASQAAHAMGYKVLLVGGEPKASFFATGGFLQSFLAYKALEEAGWQAALADGHMDLESSEYIGGLSPDGGLSHCPFWDSWCTSTHDPTATHAAWQPDGDHFVQSGYDLCGDLISATMVQLGLY